MFNRRIVFVLMTILFFATAGAVLLQRCNTPENSPSSKPRASNAFLGDQSCKSCHNKEHTDWLKSHHFMAMQPANDSTVYGDFNNSTFTADGVSSKFFKKEGKFFINTEGDDGKNHDYEVKYTFGFTPLQQYLVEFPGGRMQVPRVSWDTKKKRWFHQYPGQKTGAHDWLHWTGNAQNWNTMCASCHSTNLQKNYNIETDSYKTTYSIINVSCESCHGAGKLHVDLVSGKDYKPGTFSGASLKIMRASEQSEQINTCAPCHALKSDISANLMNTSEMMDNYIPEIPSTEHYYADGQVDDESYTYTSFLQSKMFRQNVKCGNCHNPHSGKTLYATNQLCTQCHAPKTYDDPTHTFHQAGHAASECKSCHMPGKTFMGNDLRHDHSFRVPRPDLSVKYGTPNACNNCHTDKTAQWTAAAVMKWYGPDRKYHYSEDLIPGSRLDANSETHLVKLLNDTSVPHIVKATSAHYLGSISTATSLQALLTCLRSGDAQTRYRALRGLSAFPSVSWIDNVGPLLSDKVRAVRIAAADLLISVPIEQLPGQYGGAFSSARNELKNYLTYQADFAMGNVMIGDHYLKLEDYFNAEKFYLRGLKKDSLMNYARLNLSTAYNAQGKNEEALRVLEMAARIDPKNDRIWYNMALLQHEMKNQDGAEKSFSKAVGLKTNNPRVYYNYGLLLNELNAFKKAELILKKGIGIAPSFPELYYALSFVYIKINDFSKARQTGMKLKQLDPNNPAYLQLYTTLGI